MDLFRCVVLTILFTETIGGDVFISKNESDWTTATKQCQLAEPLTLASNGQVTINIPMDISEDVWVGYYQARTAFEYFGCAREPDVEPMFNTSKEDPGQCMSACGANKRIGIFRKKCFCFKNEIGNGVQTKFPYCNKICNGSNGIVCGGKEGKNKYISLYRSIGMDDIGIHLNGENDTHINCMYYLKKKFMWSNCSVSYKTICGIGNNSWIENKKTSGSSFFGDWNQSTIECFENKTRPSTYSNTQSLHTEDSTPHLWTGIVRSQVVYAYTTDTKYVQHANMYGYLHRNDNGKIKFKLTDNRGATKKSICVNDTTASIEEEEEEGSSDVGAIVGATLSIVAAVVIVVVGVLILRKGGIQLPFLKKEKQAPKTSMVLNNKAYAISRPVEILQNTYRTEQEEYAEIDLTTTIDNEAKNGVINDVSESSAYAHEYFVLEKPEEEPYDSKQAGDQKSYQSTYNPYNKLSFEKSSNYDHLGAGNAQIGNAGGKVSDSENTYNTTSLGNPYLKTSGGESNNDYSTTEETEDTYNHTNVSMHVMGLRPLENDYDAI